MFSFKMFEGTWKEYIQHNMTSKVATPEKIAYVVVRLRQRRWGHEVHMGFLLVMRQHSSVVATASLNELIIV